MWVYCVVWAWVAFVSQRGRLSMSVGGAGWITVTWLLRKRLRPHVLLTMYKTLLMFMQNVLHTLFSKGASIQLFCFWLIHYTSQCQRLQNQISVLVHPYYKKLIQATLRVMFEAHVLLVSSSLLSSIMTRAIDQSSSSQLRGLYTFDCYTVSTYLEGWPTEYVLG